MEDEKLFSAPRWRDNPGFIPSQCNACANFERPNGVCKGFDSDIPREILLNDFIHDKAFPGDNGYRYAPRE